MRKKTFKKIITVTKKMNNRTYKLSNNFSVWIVVRENFLVSAALFCHIIRPVLRHTDAVTVAVCLKEKRTVLLLERKRRTSQRKKCSEGVSGKALAADFQAFHHARAAVRVDYIGYPAALVVSQDYFGVVFCVFSDLVRGERYFLYAVRRELVAGTCDRDEIFDFSAPYIFGTLGSAG